MILLIVQGLIPTISIVALREIIDGATAGPASGDGGTGSEQPLLWAGAFVALGIVGTATEPVFRSLVGSLGDLVGLRVQTMLYRKIVSLPDLACFEDPAFHDRLHNAQREAASRPIRFITDGAPTVRHIVTAASLVGVLWSLNPWAALIILLGNLPYAVVNFWLVTRTWSVLTSKAITRRRMEYFGGLLVSDQHAKEVKLFGFGEWLIGRFRDEFVATISDLGRVRRQSALGGATVAACAAAATGALVFYVTLEAVRGAVTPGQLAMFITATLAAGATYSGIVWGAVFHYENCLYFGHLSDFLATASTLRMSNDRENKAATERLGRPAPRMPSPCVPNLGNGIRFEGVSFAYPNGRSAVLRDLNLIIPANKVTAIVGENGAGKTTVLKLLCRFYDPSQGRILCGGQDIQELDLACWRQRIAAIFQDFGRYQMTVGENIAFERANMPAARSMAAAAAHRAGLGGLAGGLDPLGLPLGRDFGGAGLSGGQWQRVALARAFAREGADIVILDEPTASLDPRGEHEIFETFAEIARGKTAVLVSHRFSTVKIADHIVVLADGGVAEQGNHAELLARQGTYAQLYELQASKFRN